jgi:hypothetical protein
MRYMRGRYVCRKCGRHCSGKKDRAVDCLVATTPRMRTVWHVILPGHSFYAYPHGTSIAEVFNEAGELIEAHWAEVGRTLPYELNIESQSYIDLERRGVLKTFGVFTDDAMVGYATFLVAVPPQAAHERHAYQDSLYLAPECRGAGDRFVRFCDEQLAAGGAAAVHCSLPVGSGYGAFMHRLGYTKTQEVYVRRVSDG